MLHCVCAINSLTLHTCDVSGSKRRTHYNAICQPVTVLLTPEHLKPVAYLVQQGEPIVMPHARLCLCYQHQHL